MFSALTQALFPKKNDKDVKKLQPLVDQINALEAETEALDDASLKGRTALFRERLEAGETLDELLPEAFATVREAAKRTLGQRHYDVQLMGGIVLHRGMIAEMGTGEGKTLVSTLPVYLNALSGEGVHVVTVNDYLAKRDAGWMGQIYEFLGLSVGCIQAQMMDEDRRAAYQADITYGTNNEYGFDYLRDNMKYAVEQMVQREHSFAIVDEVDSILIDEARTPLIISGPSEDSTDRYVKVDKIIPLLEEGDYEKDEKTKSVTMTDDGTEKAEHLMKEHGILEEGDLYDLANVSLVNHINQALRAHLMFAKDVDYVVKDGRVHLIDEFTGRIMEGRRLSDGLHQAIEAKEGVPVQNENQTLASVTFQNYFRMYPKLAGMTGTAETEASEFAEIYGLNVLAVPSNKPMARDDEDDEVYRTVDEKYDAIVALIEECSARQQPVLVGTVSIEKSETLAKILKKKSKIATEVLNAKQHEREAHIIAQAGVPGAVTIATNMAGRGTDIQLGGNLEFRLEDEAKSKGRDLTEDEQQAISKDVAEKKALALEAGGLFVIGTERHESRRIDNQLRGRSGRQGDPGASKFYLSLEDDLMRIFGSERLDSMLQKLGLEEGEAITHKWINKALEKAQQKVELRNFDVRKQLLQYDDVMNDQRRVIFDQRRDVMRSDNIEDLITEMREEVIASSVDAAMPPGSMSDEWDPDLLHEECIKYLNMAVPVRDWMDEEGVANEEIRDRITQAAAQLMKEKNVRYGEATMRNVERVLVLQAIDAAWKDHLLQLDIVKAGINLRAYGQKQPLIEYQKEAFVMFQSMMEHLRERVTEYLMRVEVSTEPPPDALKPKPSSHMKESHPEVEDAGSSAPAARRVEPGARDPSDPSTWGRVGRNEMCPCGSGRKYKHCHGRLEAGATA